MPSKFKAMKVRNELDTHRLIEGENVFSIKKLTPKKSFSLNVLYEGEVVTTAISGMKFPSIVLHDVELLTKYLFTCFKFGGHGVLVPLELPKAKALPKAKSPEQLKNEKIRIAERAEKIALIKAQRKAWQMFSSLRSILFRRTLIWSMMIRRNV